MLKLESNRSKAEVGCAVNWMRPWVLAAGHDLNSIRFIVLPGTSDEQKGTLFVTPNSDLEKQAIQDYQETEEEDNVSAIYCLQHDVCVVSLCIVIESNHNVAVA